MNNSRDGIAQERGNVAGVCRGMVDQAASLEQPEVAHAQAAGLVYVSDTEPGIRRDVEGSAFRYVLPDGQPVTDEATLQRIRKLAVPPAYRDVWICVKENGHIQATGRDDRGRKQYRYHADWRCVRDRNKYEHILDFARALPRIRARIDRDLRKRSIGRERVLATVVSLLDKTLIRVGNGEYAKTNGSFGLTTLRDKHLKVVGSEMRFHFKGKSGKVWRLSVRDRRIARIVASAQELPGQHLFQYLDEEGQVRAIDSGDVNDYLREIGGDDVSAKDFRTWSATVLAVLALSAVGPFSNKTQMKVFTKRAIEAVADKLGNTVAICRKSYIHPEVIAAYHEGNMPRLAIEDVKDENELLCIGEAATLKLLRKRLVSADEAADRERRKKTRAGARAAVAA